MQFKRTDTFNGCNIYKSSDYVVKPVLCHFNIQTKLPSGIEYLDFNYGCLNVVSLIWVWFVWKSAVSICWLLYCLVFYTFTGVAGLTASASRKISIRAAVYYSLTSIVAVITGKRQNYKTRSQLLSDFLWT